MNLEQQIINWSKLGNILSGKYPDVLKKNIEKTLQINPWFSIYNIEYSIRKIAENLDEYHLRQWISPYKDKLNSSRTPKNIGVVMAGNIPLVGFQDFMCVLFVNHSIKAKLSHNDSYLLPAFAEILTCIDSAYSDRIDFTNERLQNFDAIIATGSNNTARYFEYYFGKYPHIIRKNRSSIAVLTGNESEKELIALADDIFMYFGLGCRSVSKIFLPIGYELSKLKIAFDKYLAFMEHSKYNMCYHYYKAIYTMNNLEWQYFDNILLVKTNELSAPVSVLHYDYYSDINEINSYINFEKDRLQCIVSSDNRVEQAIPLGKAQSPELNDYADNLDVMDFLLKL